MQQPSKNFLKDQLALAADEIIRLRGESFRQHALLEIHEDAWKEAMNLVASSGRTLWGTALGLGLLSGLLIWLAL